MNSLRLQILIEDYLQPHYSNFSTEQKEELYLCIEHMARTGESAQEAWRQLDLRIPWIPSVAKYYQDFFKDRNDEISITYLNRSLFDEFRTHLISQQAISNK